MSISVVPYGFLTYGNNTETTATAITQNIPCNTDGRLAIVNGSYTTDSSAETVSFMYAEGDGSRTTAASDAASGQADLTTSDAPKDPAGNAAASGDIVAYKTYNDTWEFNTVSSVTGSTITFNNNLSSPVKAGAQVNVIGAQGDGAEFQVPVASSSTKEFGGGNLYLAHPYSGEPMHVNGSNTGTSDSQMDYLVVAFINK